MTNPHAKDLVSIYPWLTISNSVKEYVAPDYYKKLLKEYSFGGVTDLKYLERYITGLQPTNVLELGCGSGRATDIALRMLPLSKFTLVDLSERMLDFTKKRFEKNNIVFHMQDAVNFLRETEDKYDLVYSLWSFSHSVHQHIHKLGFDNVNRMLEQTLKKFVQENLRSGGKFFLVHFDSMSDEQRILMRQWKRVFVEFSDIEQQSPSKRIIDSVLWDLDNKNEIILSVTHLKGDTITYESEDIVLETFLNFHMETYFNNTSMLSQVIQDIRTQIVQYRKNDGSYEINPGCYIYSFQKR